MLRLTKFNSRALLAPAWMQRAQKNTYWVALFLAELNIDFKVNDSGVTEFESLKFS